jgi:hypothetical protein
VGGAEHPGDFHRVVGAQLRALLVQGFAHCAVDGPAGIFAPKQAGTRDESGREEKHAEEQKIEEAAHGNRCRPLPRSDGIGKPRLPGRAS